MYVNNYNIYDLTSIKWDLIKMCMNGQNQVVFIVNVATKWQINMKAKKSMNIRMCSKRAILIYKTSCVWTTVMYNGSKTFWK